MIDFACKRFELAEIIQCGLGLSKSEYALFAFFMEHAGQFETAVLAKKLSVDITTIQRGVKKLHEKGILEQKQKNLSAGGYAFVYAAKSRSEVKKVLKKIVTQWSSRVCEALTQW